MKEPLPVPAGQNVNVGFRCPTKYIEEIKNLTMFNRFSPFPNFSAFMVDAVARNLEYWKGAEISPALRKALLLAKIDAARKEAEMDARMITEFFQAASVGNYSTARELLAQLPEEQKQAAIIHLKRLGVPQLEVVEDGDNAR